MTQLRIAIGTDNFRFIREDRAYYVDKTAMIHEVVTHPRRAMLITRPRRFGKSLNLSMLRYFFEPSDEDLSWMFQDLAVWKSKQARAHFQRHPVVSLNFKDTKSDSWEMVLRLVRDAVSEAFGDLMQDVVLATLSSRDLAKGAAASPERVFQAFVRGCW